MKLTVIGCTGSMSGPKSAASCYLVQATGFDPTTGTERVWNVALDLGPGSFGALWKHIDPSDLDAVIFSHCHADHMGDVISLHVHRRWGPARGKAPLLLAGTSNLLDRIRQIDGCPPDEDYALDFRIHTLQADEILECGPLRITPVEGWHSVPSFGVRVEGPSEHTAHHETAGTQEPSTVSMLYTGDTDLCPTMIEGARGVDLLLSEAGFTQTDDVEGIHMNGVKVGRLASEAGVGQLVVTHIQPWTDPAVVVDEVRQTWSGPLEVAVSDAVYAL
ncbi:MBL fold metallo-hydrolase [Schaalia canis]|uniref:MBL fold metallo-hydrolase n=1 Tax=Schaalia canis TaxID=100469 RepID=A0A3P1SD95_9ACTO|nr:MBL fold metallo-hydrolase [Schaalia canis]RRC95281.1 MBL fold metallo-hydrolase [Schaalia canis]